MHNKETEIKNGGIKITLKMRRFCGSIVIAIPFYHSFVLFLLQNRTDRKETSWLHKLQFIER